MATLSKTRLGPYEIIEVIGVGGMGEVYRARDTRLGRLVAVKLIHHGASLEAERVRRFELEARAAGILSHPNILAVYDIGTHEGVPYLVTELLEGETVRARLLEGPIPPTKALDYGAQIANGLAAAHAKGIIHRDLKPENVFICRDGRIKILDFGLAKLADRWDSLEDADRAATVDPASEPGRLLGTVNYMSPEQIRGRPVDHRSDIFSFGAVLYEMLTARRVFQRESAVETMNAALKEEPEIDEKSFPRGLGLIVRRCLEKEPEHRFHSANDLAFQLATLSTLTGSSTRTRPPGPARTFPAGRWLRGTALAAAAGGLVAAAMVVARRMSPAEPPAYHQLTFRRGMILSARFAPDGQTVVYGAAWDGQPFRLFSTRAGSPESRPFDLPSGDILSISRSGEMAVSLGRRYTVGSITRGTLARVPLGGGAPRELATDVDEADWAPDEKGLAVVRVSGGRYRLEYPIGAVLYETEGWISHPRVSPDGRLVAFIEHPVYADDRGAVAIIGREGGKKALTQEWSSASGLAWAPGGRELWFTASEVGPNCALRAVSLSGETRLILRAAGRLLLQDMRDDGRVLLTEGKFRIGMIHGDGRDGREHDLSWLDISVVADISADGQTLLFSEQGTGAGTEAYALYARRVDGSPAVRLGEGQAGAISPDGDWAVSIVHTPEPHLMVLPMGAGQSRRLDGAGLIDFQAVNWLPDGRHLLFAGTGASRRTRLYLLDVGGGPPRAVSDEGLRMPFYAKSISPDGRLAAVLDDEGRILFQPLDGGRPRTVQGLAAGEVPLRWSDDGKALYVFRFGELPGRIFRFDVASARKELVAELLPADPAGVGQIITVQITSDGRNYAYSYKQILSDLYIVSGLR